MTLFRVRSMTATGLSLWLGLLACLLGCAKPAGASQLPASGRSGAICPENGHDAGDSCCQHGHDSSGSSDKSGHHAKSCCPTETALTERKSAPIALAVSVDIQTSALLVARDPLILIAVSTELVPTQWLEGRDILRRVHVLRI